MKLVPSADLIITIALCMLLLNSCKQSPINERASDEVNRAELIQPPLREAVARI